MPDTPSIVIVKSMGYRGNAEEWSNKYHFTGTQPADDTAWATLANDLVTSERQCYNPSVSAVRAYGYDAGNDISVWSFDWAANNIAIPGTTQIASGSAQWAGDQAGWIRALIGRSSKGKNVYIRKYFHGGASKGPSGAEQEDEVDATFAAAYAAHMATILGGTLAGGFTWSGPQAEVATTTTVGKYVGQHRLKRRSGRPTPPA